MTAATQRNTGTRWVLMADDLTGAAECAAAFALHATTSVVLRSEAPWPNTDVVAIDTDTRRVSATAAATRVAEAVRRARAGGAGVVKKIDSTLRGNVGAEIGAALEALEGAAESSRPLALVAAAFPAVGRTTLGGRLHVDGFAATAAPFEGDLAALLQDTGMRVETVPLNAVRDPRLLARRIELAADEGLAALVVDAECDHDLEAIAHAIEDALRPLLVAGSAGIVRALAHRSRPVEAAESAPRALLPQPALFVVGSYSAAAHAQRRVLVQEGAHPVLLDSAHTHDAMVNDVRTALEAGQSVVLSPDPDEPVDLVAAAAVAARLASVAAAVLADVRTLVATGGETARAVMLRAGIETLAVQGEREAGVVGLRAPAQNLGIVTKAGAFGDPGALSRVIWPAPPKEN